MPGAREDYRRLLAPFLHVCLGLLARPAGSLSANPGGDRHQAGTPQPPGLVFGDSQHCGGRSWDAPWQW